MNMIICKLKFTLAFGSYPDDRPCAEHVLGFTTQKRTATMPSKTVISPPVSMLFTCSHNSIFLTFNR